MAAVLAFPHPAAECVSGDVETGGLAQLGERLNGIQEVEGSIPFGSTKFQNLNL